MKKTKRGQVTLFIIIGIIIVILGFILIYYRGSISQKYTEIRFPETKSVRMFIEECTQDTLAEGVALAAMQGGYIELPDQLLFGDPRRPGYLPPPPSALKVPMWWYNGKSLVPRQSDIENELAEYVKKDIIDCINEFAEFPQMKIEEIGVLNVDVDIHKNDISVQLDYPLRISIGENTVDVSAFRKAMPTRFGELYQFAKSIMEYENENAFLEEATMDIIAVADGADDSPHIPLDGYDFRCGEGERWSIQLDIIPALQQLVKYNFRYFSFDDSIKNQRFEENPEIVQEICQAEDEFGVCKSYRTVKSNYLDYYDEFYTLDTGVGNYPDVAINVLYDRTFGMNLDVEPSDGDVVKGFDLAIPLIGSCVKVYHHRYDIEFPVMFQLQDESGLIFQFATPVILEKNSAKRYISPFKLAEYEYSVSSEEYCANRLYKRVIYVQDKVTSEFLDNANVRYECVQFSCDLGDTEFPSFEGVMIVGSEPMLETSFPECVNGFLVVNKDGYQESVSQVTIESPIAQIPPVKLVPLKELPVSLYILDFTEGTMQIRELEEDERAYISVASDDYDDAAFLPETDFTKANPFELVYDDATYTVDVKVMKDDMPFAGLYFPDWQITRNQLTTANELRFYAIASPIMPEDMSGFARFWQNTVIPKSENYAPVIR
ncbi:MAG: hypothetical protein KAT43_02875 [Nanoarchaeota archaeon]|nr:hypothetical protein [Nanoarchaeota archaeon]